MIKHHLQNYSFPSLQLGVIAIFLILVWGLSFTVINVVVAFVSPMWLVAVRCILGAALVTLWTLYRGHKFPRLSHKLWLWYLGLAMTGLVIPFYLIAYAQITVDSGLTSIIVGTMPLITIILAHFFASEYLTPPKVIGFILGFMGTVILFLPDDLNLGLVDNWQPQVLILLASTFYAVTTILAKHAPKTPPSMGGAMMLICGSILATGLALLGGFPSAVPPLHVIGLIGFLGIGSTAIGTILYFYVVNTHGPSALAKINFFPPIVSVIAGVLILSEPFSWKIIAAFSLIVIGLLIARIGDKKAKLIKGPAG